MAHSASSAARTPADVLAIHERFLVFLYGNQTGYMEIVFCNGDPAIHDLKRDTWYYYTPATAHQIAQRINKLVSRYGNVYISRSLYSKRYRNRAYALPSQIIFLDDAPADPPLP
jgi:hypothetical protein